MIVRPGSVRVETRLAGSSVALQDTPVVDSSAVGRVRVFAQPSVGGQLGAALRVHSCGEQAVPVTIHPVAAAEVAHRRQPSVSYE